MILGSILRLLTFPLSIALDAWHMLARMFFRRLGGEPKLLKRMLVRVKPKQAYVHWVRQHSGNPHYTLAESRREDSHAFLLPLSWDLEEEDDVIADDWPYFFAQMLHIWKEDEAAWPEDRTLVMFRHWFEIEVCGMVFDLGDWKYRYNDSQDDAPESVNK